MTGAAHLCTPAPRPAAEGLLRKAFEKRTYSPLFGGLVCVRPLETLRVTVETAVVSVKCPSGKRHLSRVCVQGEYVGPRPITLPGPSTGGAQPNSADRSPVPPTRAFVTDGRILRPGTV